MVIKMKKNKKYIVLFIITIILFSIIIIIHNKNNKNNSDNKAVVFLNKNNNKSVLDIENNKNNEDDELNNGDPILYITVQDKTIVTYSDKQDWNSEYSKKNEDEKLVKDYFDSLWNKIDCEIIQIKKSDYLTANLQLSRYGYARDDMSVYIEKELFFYENGTNGLFYPPNQKGNGEYKIYDGNLGRSIHVLYISGKWYAYKLNVTE